MLAQKVESLIVERLVENKALSEWVEMGLILHQHYGSENCEFCGQKIPKTKLEELAKIFNEADRLLKDQIKGLLVRADIIKQVIRSEHTVPDGARLYDEFSVDYKVAEANYYEEIKSLIVGISNVEELLKDKMSKTTESMPFAISIDVSSFDNAYNKINVFLTAHNERTSDFERSKSEAIEKIKKHYLSTIFDEIKTIDDEIENTLRVLRFYSMVIQKSRKN